MTLLRNLQQILSNIPSVEKIQQVQQHQAQMEQSRLLSLNQKASENKGKKVADPLPSDKVDIRVKDDQQGMKREGKQKEREDKKEDGAASDKPHVDMRV